MLKLQISKLNEKGFKLSFDEVYDYVIKNGNSEDGINKWNIVKCLFNGINKEFNILHFKSIYGSDNSFSWFYYNCLKSGGRFYNDYKVDFGKYEPDVSTISELAKKDNAILSIAHPNFTFKKGVEEFKREIPYYIDAGVNAIEFNTKIDYEWGKAIIEVKEKYNLILTFGSDCHMIGGNDDKHSSFGTMSPFLNSNIIEENYNKFREKIGI